MKYEINLITYQDDEFISTKRNKFKTLREAIIDSEISESGFIEIEIFNNSHSNLIPDLKTTYKEAIKRNYYAKSRFIIISPNKDEIYGEYFILEGSDYYFDFNILYGDACLYKAKDKVTSKLFGTSIIANNICRVNGEDNLEDLSLKELLNREIPYNKADVIINYFRIIKMDQETNEIWEVDILPSSSIIEKVEE